MIDASALVQALVGHDDASQRARDIVVRESVFAPQGIELECISALRGLAAGNKLSPADAGNALALLAALPLRRVSTVPVLSRIWDLRHNAWPYDAAYVAIAEQLDVPLLTADVKLARIPRITCEVRVLGASGTI